jgi:hypothetical protein
MICPLCETENLEDASECAGCGKAFATAPPEDLPVETVPGLEQTLFEAPQVEDVELVPGLERTQVARRDLRIAEERVEGVEQTQLRADPAAPQFWSGGVTEVELGREADDGARTPLPQDDGFCPWCREPSTGAVCDSCGRRRSRYSVAPAQVQGQSAGDDTQLCPACFARVPVGPRCVECGVRFPALLL